MSGVSPPFLPLLSHPIPSRSHHIPITSHHITSHHITTHHITSQVQSKEERLNGIPPRKRTLLWILWEEKNKKGTRRTKKSPES